ncbi:DSBA oxidoreductase [Candidatus Propionivibrio aalborgensis]|uniref:DSBA oxidoreductase n=1 Tax=Candidatus Propionivibrio aalborgensis TaxID=1860101 RepID=A0A1A8XNI2_9RHOO|nr:DsbA family oxidoreductase [Candidatus Propionivibrio aalborgensis]MBK9026584.1 DsbA family oxidoreductase [Propionivibrio sp.]SBT05977.1 DSBA oxidoreductase [Candidatus Propionivibrio aalborgensis]
MNVSIDIVSDLVCPWCFIGKHRMTGAVALVREKFPETRFRLNWLPFFLNPDTPPEGEPYRAFLEAKFGGKEQVSSLQKVVTEAGRDTGVEFDFERISIRPNTLRAHRLIYRAQSTGRQPAEIEALVERLFVAHFQRGEDIGDIATLAEIAAECGDRMDDVTEYLESTMDVDQVRSLFDGISGQGISGVPLFVIQDRLAVPGAQSSAVLAAAILQAMEAPSS